MTESRSIEISSSFARRVGYELSGSEEHYRESVKLTAGWFWETVLVPFCSRRRWQFYKDDEEYWFENSLGNRSYISRRVVAPDDFEVGEMCGVLESGTLDGQFYQWLEPVTDKDWQPV